MTGALLISEQQVEKGFFSSLELAHAQRAGSRPYDFASFVTEADMYRGTKFAQIGLDSEHYERGSRNYSLQSEPSRKAEPSPKTSHRRRSFPNQEIVEQLGLLVRRRERERRTKLEAAWIAANRSQFAGRWVALFGGKLLAVGDNGMEVFREASRTDVTPLVIHIEDETIQPFSGW